MRVSDLYGQGVGIWGRRLWSYTSTTWRPKSFVSTGGPNCFSAASGVPYIERSRSKTMKRASWLLASYQSTRDCQQYGAIRSPPAVGTTTTRRSVVTVMLLAFQ